MLVSFDCRCPFPPSGPLEGREELNPNSGGGQGGGEQPMGQEGGSMARLEARVAER